MIAQHIIAVSLVPPSMALTKPSSKHGAYTWNSKSGLELKNRAPEFANSTCTTN